MSKGHIPFQHDSSEIAFSFESALHSVNRSNLPRRMQVVVPMDVVSSRLMVGNAPAPNSAAAPASGAIHSVHTSSAFNTPSTGARTPPNVISSPALAKCPDGRSIASSARVCSGASPVSEAATHAHRSGLHMAQYILRTEGIAGLYRCIHLVSLFPKYRNNRDRLAWFC
jgi:hypothetical protein